MSSPFDPPFEIAVGIDPFGRAAHAEVYHDPAAMEAWVREYAEGHQAFVDVYATAAKRYLEDGLPGHALAAAEVTLGIPNRSEGIDFDTIRRAMGYPDGPDWFASADAATQHAFGIEAGQLFEVSAVHGLSTGAIAHRPIEAWQEALEDFALEGQLLLAGVAAQELGTTFRDDNQPDDALANYRLALTYLHLAQAEVYNRNAGARDTAEFDTICAVRTDVLCRAVYLLTDIGGQHGLTSVQYETAKDLVYQLDDTLGDNRLVRSGYELLARSGGRHLKERWFFRREAAQIAGQLALGAQLAQGVGVINSPAPRSRQHKRPAVRQKGIRK